MVDQALEFEMQQLLKNHFGNVPRKQFARGESRIPLMEPSFGWEEVWGGLESLLSTNVTMGEKVMAFERRFANYLGVEHAVMVNSGSSANLLALAALSNPAFPNRLLPGDEVLTPAVTWPTTVYPIYQNGLVPVLVDVEPDTFNIDPDEMERAISPRTRAVMLVHLLGNPCNMDAILSIAERHDLLIIEDSCESHGAEFRGRKTGSLGTAGTFSFYFSHHINTVEGGMLVTNDAEVADLARGLRAFGWIRDRGAKDELATRYPDLDARFLFVNIGFNVRPTEMQAAFGLVQLGKLDESVELRRSNANYWGSALSKYSDWYVLQYERPETRHAWFAYPITVAEHAAFSRNDLAAHLESMNVETRPLMAGNMAVQPVMRHVQHRVAGELANATSVANRTVLVGNHHGIGGDEREAMADYLREFVSR